MTNFTLDNHLTYSINTQLYGYRTNSISKYYVSVGSVDKDIYRTSNYRNELRRTADAVYREFGKNLVIMLSGGTDSEIVIRNFIEIGIKPRCVAIKFKNNFNISDINEAIEICKELDIKLDIIDFDVKEFYKSGNATEFGNELQCTQITYLTVYYNRLKLGCPAVMGGEVLLTRGVTQNSNYWYYTFRENEDASAMRFSNKFNIPLVNEWFSYTPELLLYYLEHPKIQELISNKLDYKLSSVSTKNLVLGDLYPNIRPKIKTHGFERLLGFNFESYRQMASDQIKRLEFSLDGIEINETLRLLKNDS